jgi:hypothetical protein
MKLRAVPLLVIALLPLVMGFSKKPKFTITFHTQGDDMDMKKSIFPVQLEGRPMLFKIVPEFSQQNVVAFHPFDTETGEKGVALQLDFRGRGALEMATRTRRGQVMLAMVNGRAVDWVALDHVVEDGMVTIWRGVPEEVIKAMDKKYPRIKPGGPPTMHEELEMMPTTKTEKKRALEAQKDAAKAAEKARKSGKPEKSDVQSLDAPRAPTTNSIPVEGASPNPGVPLRSPPAVEPALPRP